MITKTTGLIILFKRLNWTDVAYYISEKTTGYTIIIIHDVKINKFEYLIIDCLIENE